MDKRFLRYYERELRHLRESAAEFGEEFPKIAGRLGLSGFECADPYVERLLEGFAFLAARVQLKMDAQFPRFTQHLIESVYPHYLAPLPSMCVVRFEPDMQDASLASGLEIPRDTPLRSVLGRGERTACEYRTGHSVRLFPIELRRATYHTRDVNSLDLPPRAVGPRGARAALSLELGASAGLAFNELELESLDFYLVGTDQTPIRLYEQIFAAAMSVVLRPPGRPAPWQQVLPRRAVQQVGFEEHEALLPRGPRSFSGYRLLREYFGFPQRFSFFRLAGLGQAVKRCESNTLEVVIPLGGRDIELEDAVDTSNFRLFCTPAINLFPKRADRIHVSEKQWEFHVVPDRTRPVDYEVFEIQGVQGFGGQGERVSDFRPFYSASDFDEGAGAAFFATSRRPRVLSSKERRTGRSTKYIGDEVFISLVDASNAPFSTDLRQLGVDTLCTNRHLPLRMSVGTGRSDLTAEAGAGIASIRIVTGPTEPRPSFAEGETAWRLINHLTLNYLALINEDRRGASALRDLLKLYADASDPSFRRLIEGVREVSVAPITRRVQAPGPIAFARGLQVTLGLDEPNFEGVGIFVFGSVMERFFAKFVSLNSFTETLIRSVDRGDVMRWPARTGQRAML